MIGRVAETVKAENADIVVLPEYRKDQPEIGKLLETQGFLLHLPNHDFRTGNQVAIFTKPELEFNTDHTVVVPGLEGLTIFCRNEQLVVGGVFFPERKKDTESIHTFLEWIEEDPFGLNSRATVLTGDFNYGVLASAWNKGKLGAEYNLIKKWTARTPWIDCSEPDLSSDYTRTFGRPKTARPEIGQKWAKGSSRPDYFFINSHVSFKNVRVLTGNIEDGVSDHEPMVGDFSAA